MNPPETPTPEPPQIPQIGYHKPWKRGLARLGAHVVRWLFDALPHPQMVKKVLTHEQVQFEIEGLTRAHTVFQISDLHLNTAKEMGRSLFDAQDVAQVAQEINEQIAAEKLNPEDVTLVFTGDGVNSYPITMKRFHIDHEGELTEFAKACGHLSNVNAGRKLWVEGNHDVGHSGRAKIKQLMADAGFVFLGGDRANSSTISGTNLQFVGTRDHASQMARIGVLPEQYLQKLRSQLAENARAGVHTVLLSHDPDIFAPGAPLDSITHATTLSGHTHGLQHNTPFLQKIARKGLGLLSNFTSGEYENADRQVRHYVHRGMQNHHALPKSRHGAGTAYMGYARIDLLPKGEE